MKDMSKKIRKVVEEYFEEEEITNLMDYGESDNLGLSDISEPVADCLVELGYPVEYNYAEESIYGDGKYDVHIGCLDKDWYTELRAWNGIDEIVEFIEEILK